MKFRIYATLKNGRFFSFDNLGNICECDEPITNEHDWEPYTFQYLRLAFESILAIEDIDSIAIELVTDIELIPPIDARAPTHQTWPMADHEHMAQWFDTHLYSTDPAMWRALEKLIGQTIVRCFRRAIAIQNFSHS